MRPPLVVLAILAQFAALAWMAGEREWIVRTGPRVWLRCAPVDPRDLFRGDYVRLNYEISTIPADKFGPGLKALAASARPEFRNQYNKEHTIHLALSAESADDTAALIVADTAPQATPLRLKGRVRTYNLHSISGLSGASYGIDAYFVEQGTGTGLERQAPSGSPDGFQVPLEIQVALGRDGTAVITGHRWAGAGTSLVIRKQSAKPSLQFGICNATTEPLAIAMPKNHGTLGLEVSDTIVWPHSSSPSPVAATTPRDPIQPADWVVLQPGATHWVDIDPGNPKWFVRHGADPPQAITDRTDASRRYHSYRITYTPPDLSTPPPQGAKVLRDRVCSRTFSSYELD